MSHDLPVTVLIDARNVQRSVWPNIPDEELVRLAKSWAEGGGWRAVVVFDGAAPAGAIGTRAESADDLLTREAARIARTGEAFWLVTSDRELRERAGRSAARVIGGGSFARELSARR